MNREYYKIINTHILAAVAADITNADAIDEYVWEQMRLDDLTGVARQLDQYIRHSSALAADMADRYKVA